MTYMSGITTGDGKMVINEFILYRINMSYNMGKLQLPKGGFNFLHPFEGHQPLYAKKITCSQN